MTVIALTDIGKRYGEVHALRDISLTLHRGEVHALLGENGAGKSTLLGILSGLVQPDSGTIAIDGFPTILPTPADSFRAGIGYQNQDYDDPSFDSISGVTFGGNVLWNADELFWE